MTNPPAPHNSALTPQEHWRNLLWALSAPEISPEYPLPWVPQTRLAALCDHFACTDIQAQLQPKLTEALSQSRDYRLGVYFENLWAFAFTHHPDYRLIARNLPLRDAGRTLGELDFVVRHIADDATEHWEVAVKFYLQVEYLWVGPGLRDRLDIKLARMRDHQLPVAKDATAQDILQRSSIRIDRQWARMPGRRFYPIVEPGPALATTNWWADANTLASVFRDRPGRFLPLAKQQWLAPGLSAGGNTLSHANFFEWCLAPGAIQSPLCIAVSEDTPGGAELGRGFLLPDHWYQQALQQHLPR